MESAKLLRAASLPPALFLGDPERFKLPEVDRARRRGMVARVCWLPARVMAGVSERAPRSRSGKYKISRRQRARPASKPDADYSRAEQARRIRISWRGAKKICRGKKHAHPTVINSRTKVYARNNVGAREEERAAKGCSKDVRDLYNRTISCVTT